MTINWYKRVLICIIHLHYQTFRKSELFLPPIDTEMTINLFIRAHSLSIYIHCTFRKSKLFLPSIDTEMTIIDIRVVWSSLLINIIMHFENQSSFCRRSILKWQLVDTNVFWSSLLIYVIMYFENQSYFCRRSIVKWQLVQSSVFIIHVLYIHCTFRKSEQCLPSIDTEMTN